MTSSTGDAITASRIATPIRAAPAARIWGAPAARSAAESYAGASRRGHLKSPSPERSLSEDLALEAPAPLSIRDEHAQEDAHAHAHEDEDEDEHEHEHEHEHEQAGGRLTSPSTP